MDKEKAFYYIKKAAGAGYTLGILNYARFLELGIGTETNLEEAKNYYKMAIEKGSIDSIFYYSSLINSHLPDLADEALYYLKEAEKGHNEAMYIYMLLNLLMIKKKNYFITRKQQIMAM